MRQSIIRALACALFTLIAADSLSAQQPAKGISIATALPVAAARKQVVKALTDGGYLIEDSTASVIHTKRRKLQRVLQLELFAKFLAVDDRSTRIVLTGNYTVEIMHEDPIPVQEASDGSAGEMWDELSAAAARVRQAVVATKS